MANNTDLSDFPDTVTIPTKTYSDLLMIKFKTDMLLAIIDDLNIEFPDIAIDYYLDPIREIVNGME